MSEDSLVWCDDCSLEFWTGISYICKCESKELHPRGGAFQHCLGSFYVSPIPLFAQLLSSWIVSNRFIDMIPLSQQWSVVCYELLHCLFSRCVLIFGNLFSIAFSRSIIVLVVLSLCVRLNVNPKLRNYCVLSAELGGDHCTPVSLVL